MEKKSKKGLFSFITDRRLSGESNTPAPPPEKETFTKEQREIMTSIVLNGDISKLTNEQRVAYVKQVCDRVGIDWSSQPFQILKLNNKERLYATKDATDQIRKVHGVSIYKLDKSIGDGLCIFTAYARDRFGKEDSSSGAVPIDGLRGENLANAIMKAETKAKRRVTLSICGLGMLDDSEVDSIPEAKRATIVVTETVKESPVPENKVSKPEPNHDKPTPEKSVDELHAEFMAIYNQYETLVGHTAALPYHPKNWKGERTQRSYLLAIPTMATKLKEAQARKEFANG